MFVPIHAYTTVCINMHVSVFYVCMHECTYVCMCMQLCMHMSCITYLFVCLCLQFVSHSQTTIFSFILGREKIGSGTLTIQFLFRHFTQSRVGDDW